MIRRRRADKNTYFDEHDIEVDEMDNIAVGTSVIGTAPYMGRGVGEEEEIVVEVNVRD